VQVQRFSPKVEILHVVIKVMFLVQTWSLVL